MRSLRRVITIVVWPIAAMLTVGCEVTTSSSSDGSAPDTAAPVEQVDRQAMNEDERTAVDAVDAFWRKHFPETFDKTYRPPRVAGGYSGTGGPSCAGEASVPYNAFYCQPGDFIAWDENLMASGYSQIGDAWVYLIIAHEWGHAIQARLNSDQVSVQAELQADCLAGATLQGAADDGDLAIEPGDNEEIAQTLAAVADDYPWTNVSDHGDAEQRTTAFNTGVSGGVTACVT
jgi:predicted metalloprotease